MLSDRGVMLREGTILDVTIIMQPTRQAIEATLKEVSNLEFAKREITPCACTVRTCLKILKVKPSLWTFLDHPDVEPTNNAAERSLRPAVIHRKTELWRPIPKGCALPESTSHLDDITQTAGTRPDGVCGGGVGKPRRMVCPHPACSPGLTESHFIPSLLG
jgi:hypothetical protein